MLDKLSTQQIHVGVNMYEAFFRKVEHSILLNRAIRKYGKDKFDELVKLGRTYKSFTVQELKDLMEKYKL